MRLLILFCLLSVNVLATDINLDGIDDLSQDKYKTPLIENYKASDDSDYKGRNKNSANTLSNKTISKSGTLSKSVPTKSSKKSAQYENLESNAGELIQKLEDDRIKVTKKYENLYTESKNTVKDTYELTKQINLDNLGSEQDPNVTNAFKCKDSKNCNKITDKRVIKECTSAEMLSWSGHEWRCVSIFTDPKSPKCDEDQWYKPVLGGAACVNYIYEWKKTGYGSCNSDALKEENYSCNRKKTVSDSGTIVSGDKCLGDKPKGKSQICEANWNVGSWVSCNKSCGGGVQTRPVTCPANNVCNSTKPSTTQFCNIHSCVIPWTIGSWRACSKACGGGVQTRSVTCLSGRVCEDPKPLESISCNMELCKANWVIGAWGSCGRDPISGKGLRKRSVTCPSGSICDANTKPLEFTDCTESWKVGAWTGCSQKFCGSQTRSVTCTSGVCSGAKPATSKVCNTSAGTFPKATCEDIWWAMEAGAPIPYDLNLFCAKPTCQGANRPSCPSRFNFIRSTKWKNSTSAWCLANNSVNL